MQAIDKESVGQLGLLKMLVWYLHLTHGHLTLYGLLTIVGEEMGHGLEMRNPMP